MRWRAAGAEEDVVHLRRVDDQQNRNVACAGQRSGVRMASGAARFGFPMCLRTDVARMRRKSPTQQARHDPHSHRADPDDADCWPGITHPYWQR